MKSAQKTSKNLLTRIVPVRLPHELIANLQNKAQKKGYGLSGFIRNELCSKYAPDLTLSKSTVSRCDQ